MPMMILTEVSSMRWSTADLHLAAGCGAPHIDAFDVVAGIVRPSAQGAGDTAAAAGR